MIWSDHVDLQWQLLQSKLLLLSKSYIVTWSPFATSFCFPTDFSAFWKAAVKVANGDHVILQCCNHQNWELVAKCLNHDHVTAAPLWWPQLRGTVPSFRFSLTSNSHWMSGCWMRTICVFFQILRVWILNISFQYNNLCCSTQWKKHFWQMFINSSIAVIFFNAAHFPLCYVPDCHSNFSTFLGVCMNSRIAKSLISSKALITEKNSTLMLVGCVFIMILSLQIENEASQDFPGYILKVYYFSPKEDYLCYWWLAESGDSIHVWLNHYREHRIVMFLCMLPDDE